MLCNLSKHNTTYTIQIQTLRRDLLFHQGIAATATGALACRRAATKRPGHFLLVVKTRSEAAAGALHSPSPSLFKVEEPEQSASERHSLGVILAMEPLRQKRSPINY